MNKQLSVVVAFGFLLGPAVAVGDSKTNRYPYDPACAWGRIADGRGMLERCLTEAESKAVLAGKLAKPEPAKKPEKETAKETSKKDAKPQKLAVSLGSLRVDEGTLSEAKAVKSLSKANERYIKCVRDHGGVAEKKKTGEVKVRFLVRGRGRAEGTEVAKHDGISLKAARCVADVIDRRFVGHPTASFTGATLVVKFSKLAK